ncbi:hypothetical protein JKP88DRAFT_262078 [Tribonema minus]|uniref:Uncharacterized protein n=1 Tax=Tribonema minus TaxID=303371 RepID=A0A835ZCN3_9STRA|nr:hypothetical protein JKP88DRAFT_262078 [Tribonema minus]
MKCMLEVAALGMLLTISLQTTVFFGHRYFSYRRVWMNLSAFLASALGLIYAAYKLGYWFAGIGAFFSCRNVMMVGGIVQGACNSMAFLHLFLRADAINSLNSKWRYLRVVGMVLVAANWAALGAVIVDRTYKEVQGPDRTRCLFVPGTVVLRVNHTHHISNRPPGVSLIEVRLFPLLPVGVQSAFFVWPLTVHIRLMDKGRKAGLGTSATCAIYRHMARRAVAAMLLSTLLTVVVTVLVIFAQRKAYPTSVLSILDISGILASIYFASCSDLAERFAAPSSRTVLLGSSVTAAATAVASTSAAPPPRPAALSKGTIFETDEVEWAPTDQV